MSAITTTTAIATTAFLFPTTSNAFSTIAQNAYTDWVANNGGNYQVSALLPAGDPTSANIAVHWSIIDDKIHLAVTAEATGWLGFGFAEAGGMPGSDIAVFTASTGKLTDAYATDYAAPIDDDQQDWTLKNYTLDGGFIIWEGERSLKTSDNQDCKIRDDSGVDTPPHKVIAAWGDYSANMSYHGQNRVKGEIRFYGSGEETASFLVAVGIVAGAIAAPVMLPALGFTTAGLAGGSIAAGAQSLLYGAYTTGVFSVLQSAGTGAVAATSAVVAGGGFLGGIVGAIVDAGTEGDVTSTKFEESEPKVDEKSEK
mmetsp:Transcript_6180/g.9097  ORF Transcript_6180/g.9097 Transcript_6180/m.9097 type:complete len:312 (-) Transcript_6180:88-1023(-)